jgi:hypothetical protein
MGGGDRPAHTQGIVWVVALVGFLDGAISLKVHPSLNHSLLFLNLLNAYSQREARVDG